ncbi:hypothetical protein KL942_000107 [Ogataea angusta]|uniref:PH domain-containing protein n=1 Tax=Pichia angusta TaxID=870730 RepID=A0ABQ7S4A6_PICAN|nr:hypothetical protein KL942_000107 [Ogataea angusta]KAG7852837.1 hypothetical protein KL940_000538 [Ogataea angusta]
MENFEVRAKSFTIKWVNAPDNSTVKWELKPLKRSVNFGIYEYSKADFPAPSTAPNSSSTTLSENLSLDEVNEVPHKMFGVLHQNLRDSFESLASQSQATPSAPNDASTGSLPRQNTGLSTSFEKRKRSESVSSLHDSRNLLEEKIDKHLVKKEWIGRCQGDELVTGTFEVGSGSLFAFIFDNTFSRHKAKTIMFNQYIETNGQVYQTAESPQPSPSYQLNPIAEQKSVDETEVSRPHEAASAPVGHTNGGIINRRASVVSAPLQNHVRFSVPENEIASKSKNVSLLRVKGGQYLQGFLLKKKRRRGGAKSFARRYFVLNFKYGVLDYYFNDVTNHVRGNMFIRNVVISADPKQLMMFLDSGIEQWILKAMNQEDFKIWVQAFNFIKRQNKFTQQMDIQEHDALLTASSPGEAQEDHNRTDFEDEVRVGRTLSVINPQYKLVEQKISQIKQMAESLQAQAKQQKKGSMDRRGSFFRKKNKKEQSDDQFDQESITGSVTAPMPGGSLYDSLVSEIKELQVQYMLLVNTETNRGFSRPPQSPSRRTLTRTNTATTSVFSQEFFDAQEYIDEMNRGVYLVQSSDEDDSEHENKYDDASMSNIFDKPPFGLAMDNDLSNSTSSSDEDDGDQKGSAITAGRRFSAREDLYPLGLGKVVQYRKDIKESPCDPPSLIGFLRKNIGKDLSSISMPVSANEPLSFLQKYSESFEYTHLLTDAMKAPVESGQRVLLIAAFAVSYLSSLRVKIRSVRKPFNPLLGETFELVRNDLGIRLVAEKVVHRPFIIAAHVESKDWTVDHVLSPQQKYGGKSAEVSIIGELTLRLSNGEVYKWSQPTTLLKNLIAGEKYSEPCASVTVSCSSGYKATVNFKASGMFSGRSEELTIKAYDGAGNKLPKEVVGTWTDSLRYTDNGECLWKVGNLVPDYQRKYGFTEFAASLNQITEIDEGCAPTDSRLRPDQREYENGAVDEAEELKQHLEEEQRKRRKNPDGTDAVHVPAFFQKAGDGDYDWSFIEGENSYWNRRKRNDWDGLVKLW